jgi:DNA modification methylase
VVCGDCTDAGAWEKALNGAKTAALLLTDPPYNVDLGGYGEHFDDARAADEYAKWTRDWFTLAQAQTERQIVTPGRRNTEGDAAAILPDATGCWVKTNAIARGKVALFACWEPIFFYGTKWPRERANDVFNFPVGQQAETGGHPCPKPLALWTDLLENYSDKGATVVDCFCGSGTILVAAESLGRVAAGIELSAQWVDVTVKRWQRLTGEAATLESDGTPFPSE